MKLKLFPLAWMIGLCLLVNVLKAQQPSVFDLKITGSYQEKPLPEILSDLESRYPVKFYYIPDKIPFFPITADVFRYGLNFGYNWQNYQMTALWSKVHSDRFSTKFLASVGAYRAEQSDPEGNDAFALSNGLNSAKFKIDNLLATGRMHALRFGLESNLYFARPEAIRPLGDISAILPEQVKNTMAAILHSTSKTKSPLPTAFHCR